MTKAESKWIADILQLGCICCRLEQQIFSPAECHHMLDGGRRMGHLFTIPLCFLHHRSGRCDKEVTSRDHSKPRFEKRYGTETYLLQKTKLLVARMKLVSA